ncbi:MAG: glycosyltransferase family 2 protein [Myxococcota bacterium]
MAISLSIVMFAYNEHDNISPVVAEVVDSLTTRLGEELTDYQLILVDDGSTDGTHTLIEALAADNPRITPMSHGTNRGIGAAVKTGFAAARMDYISILPADGQVAVDELYKLLPSIEAGADMALGYFTQRGQVDGPIRWILSRGLRQLMRMALGTQRPMDGVYMFRRTLLRELPLTSQTFFVNLELPVRAIRDALDVRSVAVEVRPRRSGQSKVLGLRRMVRVGREVLAFRIQLIREQLGG